MKPGKMAKAYRVDGGKHFRLKDLIPPTVPGGVQGAGCGGRGGGGIVRLAELQDKLYAQDRGPCC